MEWKWAASISLIRFSIDFGVNLNKHTGGFSEHNIQLGVDRDQGLEPKRERK
jgi:hypothetical protein